MGMWADQPKPGSKTYARTHPHRPRRCRRRLAKPAVPLDLTRRRPPRQLHVLARAREEQARCRDPRGCTCPPARVRTASARWLECLARAARRACCFQGLEDGGCPGSTRRRGGYPRLGDGKQGGCGVRRKSGQERAVKARGAEDANSGTAW